MLNIKIIYDSVDFTIIQDNVTRFIWLYSDRKPIAYFDVCNKKLMRYDKSDRQSNHIGVFKKKLKNNEL